MQAPDCGPKIAPKARPRQYRKEYLCHQATAEVACQRLSALPPLVVGHSQVLLYGPHHLLVHGDGLVCCWDLGQHIPQGLHNARQSIK